MSYFVERKRAEHWRGERKQQALAKTLYHVQLYWRLTHSIGMLRCESPRCAEEEIGRASCFYRLDTSTMLAHRYA